MPSATELVKANYHKCKNEEELKDLVVKELGCARQVVSNTIWKLKRTDWWKDKKIPAVRPKPSPKVEGGYDSFRQMFSKTAIELQKTSELHKRVEKLVDGELKERKWMPEQEVKDRLKMSSVEYSVVKRDFDSMTIRGVKDKDGRVFTIWAHPADIDNLRSIMNE